MTQQLDLTTGVSSGIGAAYAKRPAVRGVKYGFSKLSTEMLIEVEERVAATMQGSANGWHKPPSLADMTLWQSFYVTRVEKLPHLFPDKPATRYL